MLSYAYSPPSKIISPVVQKLPENHRKIIPVMPVNTSASVNPRNKPTPTARACIIHSTRLRNTSTMHQLDNRGNVTASLKT